MTRLEMKNIMWYHTEAAKLSGKFDKYENVTFVKDLFKVDETLNILIRLRKVNGKRKLMKMKI